MSQDTGELRKEFLAAGFEVLETTGGNNSFAVKKGPCQMPLESVAGGDGRPAGPPTLSVHGMDCRLEDRGYQKFWLHGSQRFPIRVSDLRTLHKFDEEVRSILGMRSLYHESLGTRSARTAYDRLDGRPDR